MKIEQQKHKLLVDKSAPDLKGKKKQPHYQINKDTVRCVIV